MPGYASNAITRPGINQIQAVPVTVHDRKAKLLFLMSAAVLALAPVLTAQTISVFASGFNNPRGLKFGPDGNLYVAEGGAGGTASSVGQTNKCRLRSGLTPADSLPEFVKLRPTEP